MARLQEEGFPRIINFAKQTPYASAWNTAGLRESSPSPCRTLGQGKAWGGLEGTLKPVPGTSSPVFPLDLLKPATH